MATTDAVDLLRSIDGSLKQLVRLLSKAAPVEIADDRDLDGKYGDPEVRFLPRDWTGADYKGCRFSECPPELLDLLAGAFDYFAKKAEDTNETHNGKPVAPYKRKDAARARGWAKRIRAGKGARGRPSTPEGDFDDKPWPDDLTADDVGF